MSFRTVNIPFYFFVVSLRCPPLTHNVRAAWRRRGVRYSSCGTQTFMFPLHFLRRYTPACAKPPVICWHFVIFVKSFHVQRNLCFIGTKRMPFFICSVSVATNPNLLYASTAYNEEFTDISKLFSIFEHSSTNF